MDTVMGIEEAMITALSLIKKVKSAENDAPQVRNPKTEIRRPKEGRNPKSEAGAARTDQITQNHEREESWKRIILSSHDSVRLEIEATLHASEQG
jgi:hypothetical protein